MAPAPNYGSVRTLSPDELDDAANQAQRRGRGPTAHSRTSETYSPRSPLALPSDAMREYSEQDPFLPHRSGSSSRSTASTSTTQQTRRRVSSLWLVPVVFMAGISRGITMAPRIEVYTQVACDELHRITSSSSFTTPLSPPSIPHDSHIISSPPTSPSSPPLLLLNTPSPLHDNSGTAGVKGVHTTAPSEECLRDPAVQSRAAGIQATLATILGVLSIVTAGYWGQISDAFGRKAALCAILFGMAFHNVVYILVSIPDSVFKRHAWGFLTIGPVVEGLLGSMTTFHAAEKAYLADCASGSRSTLFAYFQGTTYVALATGPQIAGFFLRATNVDHGTAMFYVGLVFNVAVFCYALLILPETVTPEMMHIARHPVRYSVASLREEEKASERWMRRIRAVRYRVVAPLTIFGPKRKPGGGWDLNMTMLVIAQFTHLMSVGVVQVKFLYAQHMFAWSVKELSYYISLLWILRAFHLLLLLPTIVRFIKPKLPADTGTPGGRTQAISQDMKFDYRIAQVSIFLDAMAYVLTIIAPSSSELLFVCFTSLSSFTAGVNPAIHSLAVSYLFSFNENASVGQMFGGMSMLQAISHTLQPLVFGVLYSETVATYPKAIFALAAGLLISSSAMFTLLRTDVTTRRDTEDVIQQGGGEPLVFDDEDDNSGGIRESNKPLLAEVRVSGPAS